MAHTDDPNAANKPAFLSSIRKPLLIGLLVDVSGSMNTQMNKEVSDTQTRLEGLRDSLDDLVVQARTYCTELGEDTSTLFHLFAYGFGFGNIFTRLRGQLVPAVRNLFAVGEDSDVILNAKELLDNWKKYRSNVLELSKDMLGATPMVEAFSKAEELFSALRAKNQ